MVIRHKLLLLPLTAPVLVLAVAWEYLVSFLAPPVGWEWKPWFAWWPVEGEDGRTYWLETVESRREYNEIYYRARRHLAA